MRFSARSTRPKVSDMGCGVTGMAAPFSLAQNRPTLPHIGEIFGRIEGLPGGFERLPPPQIMATMSSSSSLRDSRETSPTTSQLQAPASLSNSPVISCPKCVIDGEYIPVRVGDTCRRCQVFISQDDWRRSSVPNLVDFRSGSTEGQTYADHQSFIPSNHTQWTRNIPFCAPPRSDTLHRPSNRFPRRQLKRKDPYEKFQVKYRHKKKEKWRRDRLAVYTENKRRMHHLLKWPGTLCGCSVKSCGPPKDLNELTPNSKQDSKGGSVTGSSSSGSYSRSPKDESKSAVQHLDVLWHFSYFVHHQKEDVPSIIEGGEKDIDHYLEVKEKLLGAEDKKSREQGEREIKSREEYNLLVYMLEQCSEHGIELDGEIAVRQERRRHRIGLECGEDIEVFWGEGSSVFDEEERHRSIEGSLLDGEDNGPF